ncbi:MAG: hypothetical protein AAFO88_10900 [Pseudomonadota bacterium]
MSSVRTVKLPLAVAVAIALAGCATDGGPDLEASSEASTETRPELTPADAEARELAERMPPLERANFWAQEYAKTPTDLDTAIFFGRALAAIGSHERVVEVMTETEVIHPMSAEVKQLKARSLSAEEDYADARRALQAAALLAPDDAGILASLGLANDRLGDHRTAQVAYSQALDIEPDRVITLSNYGLSLALTGNLDEAEMHLRRAASLQGANTNVRQNLALVLGLQGRFDEMMEAASDAPEETMRRNAELLRALRGDAIEAAPEAAVEASPVDTSDAAEAAPAKPLGLRRSQAG